MRRAPPRAKYPYHSTSDDAVRRERRRGLLRTLATAGSLAALLVAALAYLPSNAELNEMAVRLERELARSDELKEARAAAASLRGRVHALELEKAQAVEAFQTKLDELDDAETSLAARFEHARAKWAEEYDRLLVELREAQREAAEVRTQSKQVEDLRDRLVGDTDSALDIARRFDAERENWQDEREALLQKLAEQMSR